MVDSPLFVVVITLANNGKCLIKANDDAMLVALILRRLRAREGLTVREVSLRLKSKSPNAYAQYETGKVAPSMDTLTKLLRALNPQFEPVLKIVA